MTEDETAPGPPAPLPGRKKRTAREIIWVVLSAIFALSVALSALSVMNYTEIARAMALTDVVTEDFASLSLDPEGNLESVNMTVNFTIVNPSGREIRAWVLTYKSWVRDLPLESGIGDSRKGVDGTVVVDSVRQRFYPVFVAWFSFDSPKVIVPAGSNLTITKHIMLNRTNFPDIMSNFEEIYNHAMGTGEELEWMHYSSAILFVHGIPEMPDSQREAVLIARYEGVDISPGVGGAYP